MVPSLIYIVYSYITYKHCIDIQEGNVSVNQAYFDTGKLCQVIQWQYFSCNGISSHSFIQ